MKKLLQYIKSLFKPRHKFVKIDCRIMRKVRHKNYYKGVVDGIRPNGKRQRLYETAWVGFYSKFYIKDLTLSNAEKYSKKYGCAVFKKF